MYKVLAFIKLFNQSKNFLKRLVKANKSKTDSADQLFNII